jgi:DNA-binding response OmpR family regulator
MAPDLVEMAAVSIGELVISENFHTAHEEIPRHILVVDDESLIRWAASTAFADAGFTVTEAACGHEAQRRARETPTLDFALLDFKLPDTDGISLLWEIRALHPSCRFLMMTAFRTPELTQDTATEKIQMLDKPFTIPDLVGRVTALLRE